MPSTANRFRWPPKSRSNEGVAYQPSAIVKPYPIPIRNRAVDWFSLLAGVSMTGLLIRQFRKAPGRGLVVVFAVVTFLLIRKEESRCPTPDRM